MTPMTHISSLARFFDHGSINNLTKRLTADADESCRKRNSVIKQNKVALLSGPHNCNKTKIKQVGGSGLC